MLKLRNQARKLYQSPVPNNECPYAPGSNAEQIWREGFRACQHDVVQRLLKQGNDEQPALKRAGLRK